MSPVTPDPPPPPSTDSSNRNTTFFALIFTAIVIVACFVLYQLSLYFEDASSPTFRHNRAVELCEQGKYAQAEAKFREVWQWRNDALGAKHADTLNTRDWLAYTLHKQGKNTEAGVECRQTLKFREDVLGEDHPDTLNTRELLRVIIEEKKSEANP